MERLARMPVIGDRIDTDQFHFRVLSIDGHRVGRVLIEGVQAVDDSETAAQPDASDLPESDA